MLENKDFDRASYRNRGGYYQRLVTFYKIKKHGIKSGKNNLIKSSAEFKITDGACLSIGNNRFSPKNKLTHSQDN